MNKLKLDNIIEDGKYKGKKVSELALNKKVIFELLKNGYNFDDEVLLQAGIKKTVRDIKTRTEVVEKRYKSISKRDCEHFKNIERFGNCR